MFSEQVRLILYLHVDHSPKELGQRLLMHIYKGNFFVLLAFLSQTYLNIDKIKGDNKNAKCSQNFCIFLAKKNYFHLFYCSYVHFNQTTCSCVDEKEYVKLE